MVQVAMQEVMRVGELLDAVEGFMAKGTFGYEFTIEDYPISYSMRGRCKLGIEQKANKGVRTVRTTTDKNGRWCAPKVSTYKDRQDTGVFVLHERPDQRAGWVFFSLRYGVWLAYANGDTLVACKSPFPSPPRRAAIGYMMNGSRLTLEASPHDEVVAWDAWVKGLNAIGAKAALAIKHHGGVFSEVK